MAESTLKNMNNQHIIKIGATFLKTYLAKIEEISSLSYDDITTGTIETKQRISSDPTNYLYFFQRQTEAATVDSNFNTSVTDVGLKRITVTVFWGSPLGASEKSIQLNSVVADF